MSGRTFIMLIAFTLIIITVSCYGFIPVSADAELRVEDITSEVYCACGCNMILSACEESMQCSTADVLKEQIKAMIKEGKDKGQILEMLQEIYGPTIVANPPKEGFNLTLWTYPILGLAVGFVAIYILSKRRKNVKWYHDPDDVLELSEEEFIDLEDSYREEYEGFEEDILSKYQRLFEEEYERFKARKKERNKD